MYTARHEVRIKPSTIVPQASFSTRLRLTVRERVNLCGLAWVAVNPAQASKSVLAVNVHGTGAANALAARTTEGEGRIHLILDLNESVKNLRVAYA